MPVQTSYSERHGIAREGLLDGVGDITTRLVETAAGIGFGKAVSRGSADQGAVLGGSDFLGVSVKDVTIVPSTSLAADIYPQKSEMGVRVTGNIWVKPSTDVTPASPVYYNKTTGAFSGTVGTPTVGPADGTGNAAGTGALTLATPAYSATVKEGNYRVQLRDPETATGEFDVIRPDGTIDGQAHVGVAYDGEIKFTIADGTPDFTAGEGFTVPVVLANTLVSPLVARWRDTASANGYARLQLRRPG